MNTLDKKGFLDLEYGKIENMSETTQEALLDLLADNLDYLLGYTTRPRGELNRVEFDYVVERVNDEQNKDYFFNKLFNKIFSFSDYKNPLIPYYKKFKHINPYFDLFRLFEGIWRECDYITELYSSTFTFSVLPYIQNLTTINYDELIIDSVRPKAFVRINISLFHNLEDLEKINVWRDTIISQENPCVSINVVDLLYCPQLFERINYFLKVKPKMMVRLIANEKSITERYGNKYFEKVNELLDLCREVDSNRIVGVVYGEYFYGESFTSTNNTHQCYFQDLAEYLLNLPNYIE